MRRFSNPQFIVSAAVIVIFLVVGLFPHLFTVYSPFAHDMWHDADATSPPFPPSPQHWFGTDDWGRDTYTQIIYGVVPTLRDATFLVAGTVFTAFCLALITTLYRPRMVRFVLDTITQTMTLVPTLVLAILFLEIPPVYFDAHSAYWYYGVIAVLEIARFVRVIEGDMQLFYRKQFIEAAVTSGASTFYIFRKHMMPWLWPYLYEYIPTQYARILTVVGELAYFGLYNQVQVVQGAEYVIVNTKDLDWATMIGLGSHDWFSFPSVLLFPTLAFCILVLAFRMMAVGVKKAYTIERAQYWPWSNSGVLTRFRTTIYNERTAFESSGYQMAKGSHE